MSACNTPGPNQAIRLRCVYYSSFDKGIPSWYAEAMRRMMRTFQVRGKCAFYFFDAGWRIHARLKDHFPLNGRGEESG